MGKDGRTQSLHTELIEIQWANKKLGNLIEGLRNQIELAACLQGTPEGAPAPEIAPLELRECLTNQEVLSLKNLLAQAKYCNFELEEENALLREEIEDLLQELCRYEKTLPCGQSPVSRSVCPYAGTLSGKKVTLIGGVESLECHYRDLIESSGGRFCRHDGGCNGSPHDLEECISGSDLVVCPIEEKCHEPAKSVLKICKATGVRCCFPKSASITGLRKALRDHYPKEEETDTFQVSDATRGDYIHGTLR